MESVYLETSFVSLLVGNPSRDLVTAANQQTTRDWWRLRRHDFLCVASAEVVREASRGDAQEIRKRLEILRDLPMLPVAADTDSLMLALLATQALPARAQADAAHLAIAAAAKTNYLLTWNCRHLANAQILGRLEAEAERLGWKLPKVCTPLELMGDFSYETGPDP
jgi:predicted nucleic acid-binding protein